MPLFPPLSEALAGNVLRALDVPAPRHDVAWLDALVQQYGRRVPWESASRIARAVREPAHRRPRLPESFWHDALTRGMGGTCFESNAAVSALLAALGFEGVLTINDTPERQGCHTAVIVSLATGRVVVDVGYPLYAVLPLDVGSVERVSPWFSYKAIPSGCARYRIENHPHPSPHVFDLVDEPVPPDDYEAALRRDHEPGGLFLDRVVLRKVVDEQVWRFTSHERPWHLQCFVRGTPIDHPLPQDVPAAAQRLSRHFGLDMDTLATALARQA